MDRYQYQSAVAAGLLLLQEVLGVRDCALDSEHARQRGVALREHHEVVVTLAQLDLEVLQLRPLTRLYAPQSEHPSHAARKNPRKGDALAKAAIPEHVHLVLLLHTLASLRPQLHLREAGGWAACGGRVGGAGERPARGGTRQWAGNVLLGAVGLRELQDGVDHELIICGGGCVRAGVERVEAVERGGVKGEGRCVRHHPLLKYTFKIKAYSAYLMQHILAVLVECTLGSPPHQQQIERESSVVIVLAGETHQLAHVFLVLLKKRPIRLPPGLFDQHRHQGELYLVKQQQPGNGPQRFVDGQLRSEWRGEGDGSQDGVHLGQGVSLVERVCLGVSGGLVVRQFPREIFARLSVAHLIMNAVPHSNKFCAPFSDHY